MRPELKKFLQDHRSLIEREKYTELYTELATTLAKERSDYINEMTEFLISCDMNPLDYMNKVPIGYMKCSTLLDHIVIPDHITSVQRAAFICSDLQTVTFNDTSKCTHIMSFAFKGCEKLESVILSECCTYIGTDAFRNCDWLESVCIPTKSDQVYIDEEAFAYCPYLTIYCNSGPVEDYCIQHNISYKLLGERT